jgi:hypothetical protein
MIWEVALVSLRLTQVYLLQGDRRRLGDLLKEMLYQLRDIERMNKVLGAAYGEFLAEATRGQISAEVLDHLYHTMRGGAQHAPPFLPASLRSSSGTSGRR